jgi:hypothetical protein
MTELTLTAALADLMIEFPEAPSLETTFARLSAPPVRQPILRRVVVVVIVAAFAVVALVAPIREAVADWLGIGVIRIVEVDQIPGDLEDTIGDLGIEVGEGAFILGPDGPVVAILGDPSRTYTRVRNDRVVEISFVWLPTEGLPEVGSTGVSALLTRFDGSLDDPLIEKSVGEGTNVTVVAVGDGRGYWIEGEVHSFGYLDPSGEIVFETLRLAGDTLLWEADGFAYRLESGLDLQTAIEVAEALGE